MVITRGSVSPAAGRSGSIPNPRVMGTVISGPVINGTNAASRVPAVATSNNGAGQVIRGGNDGWASPVAGGVGSPVPGGIGSPVPGGIRSPVVGGIGSPTQSANRPAVPFGGMTANPGRITVNPGQGWGGPGGVTVNPTQGWNYGPVVRPTEPSTPYPPPDTNSEWYRRYRDRGQPWPDSNYGGHWDDWPYGYGYGGYGYGYGPYGPVFIQNYYQPGLVQAAAEAEREDEQEQADAADKNEAGNAARDNHRKRPVVSLTPEKLHELMLEGVKLFKAGKYNESAAKFLRVTLADRQNVDATLAYAVARFATGDYQIAGLAVRRAVRRMPEVVDSSFDIRARYTVPEQFQNHLARLEQYVRDNPEDEDAWTVLGFIRHFSGQRELAAETFRRLRLFPGADAEVAEIFLSAKPAEAAAQTQPADVVPMVPPAHDRPLPAPGEELVEELISIEPAE